VRGSVFGNGQIFSADVTQSDWLGQMTTELLEKFDFGHCLSWFPGGHGSLSPEKSS
jgi:hypothetical protein